MMGKLFYKTKRDVDRDHGREVPEGESMTIQDEVLKMSEILSRAQNGLEPRFVNDAQYFDVEDIRLIDRYHSPNLDLTDLEELKRKHDGMTKVLEDALKKKQESEEVAEEEVSKDVVDDVDTSVDDNSKVEE